MDSRPVAELAVSAFQNLDFPIIVVDEVGKIVIASQGAQLLVPKLMDRSEDMSILDLLVEPPPVFSDWLDEACSNSSVRFRAGTTGATSTILVKATPWSDLLPAAKLWILSLHKEESISRQKYEREILLRISSVPIPEMTGEGHPLTPQEPEGCPITHELIQMVVNYLGGQAGLLLRMEGRRRLSVIGQCGFSPDTMAALLSRLEEKDLFTLPADGILRNAAGNGFPFSLYEEDDVEGFLQEVANFVPFVCRGFWVDGITGFGAGITMFPFPPDHVARQFATDAYVRLGRHLETITYNNQMFDAYLKLQSTQEQIIQSGKMAAIGELATGMAHELRQPVTAINNFFTTIFDFLEAGRFERLRDRVDDYRERSRRNIDRLTGIIDHLRTFGRQESINFQPTDFEAFITEIFNTLLDSQLSQENITVNREIPADLPLIEMDGPRIEQVILNLVSNARDALEDVPNPTITIGLTRNDPNVEISISDNGPGIAEEIMDKVLNPFFTTKAAGKGTGLGLSLSHSIIEGHNGSLQIENCRDGGACFKIELPIKQPKQEDAIPMVK